MKLIKSGFADEFNMNNSLKTIKIKISLISIFSYAIFYKKENSNVRCSYYFRQNKN